MKKSQYFILLAAILFMAFTQRQEAQKDGGKFTVTGTIDTTAGTKFYTQYRNGDSTISDSFRLADDKRIRFTGEVSEPTQFHISLFKNHTVIPSMELTGKYSVWVEPGQTTRFQTKAGSKKVMASGTKAQDQQNAFEQNNIDQNLRNSMAELYKKVAIAKQKGTLVQKKKEFDMIADTAYADWTNGILKFIESHPDSYVSLMLLKINAGYPIDKNKSAVAFNGLSTRMKNSPSAKSLKEKMGLEGKLAIGAIAPDFTEQNTEGKPVKLSSMRGKYVLLDFWASWCVPCRAENPNLKKAYEKYHQKGFDILSVSLDDKKEPWLKAVKDDKLSWLQISDLRGFNGTAGKLYKIHAIPDNYLLDKEGRVVDRNLRGEELGKKLNQIL